MDFATKGLARLEGYDSATGHTALTKASVGGELAQVKHLISWGVNLDTVSRIDLTSLMSAVIFGHKEVFQSLLAAKADVNVRTREGTALLCAAIHGSLDLVQSLLAVKADVDAGDADGAPPLFRAALNGHSEVVQALITAGAKIDPTARYMARFERRRNLPSLLKFALGQGGRA
jgi:ankyrin repeat protein